MNTTPNDFLWQAMSELGSQRRRLAGARRALNVAAAVGLAVLVLLVLDAAVGLPVAVRLTALLMLGAGGAWMIWRGRGRQTGGGGEALADARRLEVAHHLGQNPLVAAMQVSGATPSTSGTDPLTRGLIERTLRRGEQALEGVDREAVLNWRGPRRAGAWLWAVAVAWLVVGLIQPGVLGVGLGRLLWPWGGEPAFSLTRFEVRWASDPVQMGDDVQVRVTLDGPTAQQAHLVQPDEASEAGSSRQAAHPWPMQAQGDHQFVRTLVNVREPVTFWIEAGEARSRTVQIIPRRPGPDAEGDDALAAPSREGGGGEADPGGEPGDAQAGEAQSVWIDRLRDLAQRARGLAGQADAVDAEVSRWQEDLRRLVDELREQAGQPSSAASSPAWDALAEALMNLPLLSHASLEAGGQALAERQHGAGQLSLRASAQQSAQRLESLARQLGAGASGTSGGTSRASSGRSGEQSAAEGRAGPAGGATVEGTYHEGAGAQAPSAEGHLSEAVIQRVPPAYRDLVADYFKRLAKDEPPAESPDERPETRRP